MGMESGCSLFIDDAQRRHRAALSVLGPTVGKALSAASARTCADDPDIKLSQVVVR